MSQPRPNKSTTFKRNGSKREQPIFGQTYGTHRPDREDTEYNPAGRNRRTVWELSTESFSGAHYATFPTKLVEPMVLASTSARGVCPECGRQWARVVERAKTGRGETNRVINDGYVNGKSTARSLAEKRQAYREMGMEGPPPTQTTGWQPTCKCGNPDTIPAVILDPFCGSGTVGEVCRNLGRRFIGIDLSAKYLQENALPRAEFKTSEAALSQLPMFSDIAP